MLPTLHSHVATMATASIDNAGCCTSARTTNGSKRVHLCDSARHDTAGVEPRTAVDAVLAESAPMPEDSVAVKGYDFNNGVDYDALLNSYATSGFQATNFGQAVERIADMIKQKYEGSLPVMDEGFQSHFDYPTERKRTPCTIFLGFTSNMISSGLRDTFRYLAEHNLIDCIVTSAGGIEEDFIKCLAPTYLGDFTLKGSELRSKGLNRIGNLLVPNSNYCRFEDWLMPILDRCLVEQNEQGVNWTPSMLIARLGQEINDSSSVYYWAYRNHIPVFCPSLTDGSLGDMLYFHSYKNPGLRIDIVQDIRHLNDLSLKSHRSGVIVLGGGLVKHHILNANLMRNGADYAVFVNTGQEYDGSDGGARPDEAVSWGKIKPAARPVKLYADATLVFPLLVAKTFARLTPAAQQRRPQK